MQVSGALSVPLSPLQSSAPQIAALSAFTTSDLPQLSEMVAFCSVILPGPHLLHLQVENQGLPRGLLFLPLRDHSPRMKVI